MVADGLSGKIGKFLAPSLYEEGRDTGAIYFTSADIPSLKKPTFPDLLQRPEV